MTISGQRDSKAAWLPVVGYEEVYEVSSAGLVKRLGKEKCLSQHVDSDGYVYVTLCIYGKASKKFVHRLVAEAFVTRIDMKPQGNHIDGVKSNNSALNLEWVTPKENVRHAFSTGLNRAGKHLKAGEEHRRFIGNVVATCMQTGKETILKGAKDIRAKGFTDSLVYRCVNGKLAHHKKHTFRRVHADI